MIEATLVLRLSGGKLDVQGSTTDKFVLYGLLGLAHDAIRSMQATNTPQVETAGPEMAKALLKT